MTQDTTVRAAAPAVGALVLRERRPAAAICLWPDPSHADATRLFEEACQELSRRAGTPVLESRLVPVLPSAGDPAVFDAALTWLQDALGRLAREAGLEIQGMPLRALIFPTLVERRHDRLRLLPDPLLEDLRERWPRLSAPGVYLTAHASRMLETPPRFIRAGSYRGPSGHTVPIVSPAEPRSDLPPWRNPDLLGRRIKFCPRPAAEALVAELLELPAARLAGGLGGGKTRLVWELLRRREERSVWLLARPGRRARPGLADQLLQQLASPAAHHRDDPLHPGGIAAERREEVRRRLAHSRTAEGAGAVEQLLDATHLLFEDLAPESGPGLRVVVDDVECLCDSDAEYLAGLLASPLLGERLRLLLVGRPLVGRERLAQVPAERLPDPAEAEAARIAALMMEGLSVPDTVRERFLAACGPTLFAFEEGLFGLLHERAFRRVYGSFFFAGGEGTGYRPSLRLVRHLLAEAGRVGAATPLELLAMADGPLPEEELTLACAAVGDETERTWAARAAETGLIRTADSPWGPGLEFARPAMRIAMRFTVAGEESRRVRHELGQLLAGSSEGEATWQAYRLLAGSPEAIPPLLAATAGEHAAALPRDAVVSSLAEELAAHRARGGGERLEMELLWRLLPLARRIGALQQFRGELDRALELSAERPNRLLAIAGLKAELEHEGGDSQKAERTIHRALKAAASSDQSRQALLLIQLGKILLRQARPRDARRVFERLLPALDDSGSQALNATCRFFLGNIALQEGRIQEAWDHHEAALEARLALGLKRPSGSSYSALGAVAVALGNYPQALDCYQRAHELLEEFGQEGETSFALLGAGRALARLGDFARASAPLRRALELREGRDDRGGEAIARLAVAANHLALGQLETALEEARRAHFDLSMLSLEDALADAEQLLGRIAFIQRRHASARRHFAAALELHGKHGAELDLGFDHAWLLETALAEGDAAEVGRHVADLKSILGRLPPVDLGEILNFRLFEGLDWLSRQGQKVGDPTPYLVRAYRQVLEKAQHLEPDQRNRFLSQIPVNQEIVAVATRRGVGA